MDYIDFHNKVIQNLQSESLKNAINESGQIYVPIELFKIIYDYIDKYNNRINFLKDLALIIDDEKLKEYINYCVEWLSDKFVEFKRSSDDYIYELIIKETPETGSERFMCKSFSSALDLIDEYYKIYDFEPDEQAFYEIIKHRVFTGSMDEVRDFSGSCVLDYQKNFCKVIFPNEPDYYSCDGVCFECERQCITNVSIKFPDFIKYKDLVKYQSYNKCIKYGICLDELEYQGEDCYIVPLDCFALRYNKFEKAHDFHKHIPFPYIEKASETDLSNDNKKIYRDYLLYLDDKQ